MIPFKWENTDSHKCWGEGRITLLLVCLLLYDPTLQHMPQNKQGDFLALLYCKSPTKCQSCTRVNYQAEEHKSPFKGNIKWEAGHHSHQQESGSEPIIIFPEIFQCSLYICGALIIMVWLFPSFTHTHTKKKNQKKTPSPHKIENKQRQRLEVQGWASSWLDSDRKLLWSDGGSCAFSSKRLCTLLEKAKPIAAASPAPLKCHFLLLWKLSHRYTSYTHSNTACSKLAGDSFPHTNSQHIFKDPLLVCLRKQRVLLNDTWAHGTLKTL